VSSIDELVSEITALAREEAEGILAAADAEVNALIGAAKLEAKEVVDEASLTAERRGIQQASETVASARQSAQTARLLVEREALETARSRAEEQLGSPGLSGRKDLLKALLAEAKDADVEKPIMRPVEVDRPTLESMAKNSKFGDSVDGLGGFVLESADQTIRLDFRFDARLDRVWDEKIPEVSQILRGEA